MLVWAKQTILATGGCGQIYRETTNPPVATGDGHAIAYRAGAELRDMEFMQFHPTVLYIAGGSRSLITEAVRGEGGWLVDNDGHPLHARLRPARRARPARHRLARRSSRQMEKTRHPCVYLDLTHLDAGLRPQTLPRHRRRLQQFGIDITARPDPRPPRRPLHDRRRDGRPPTATPRSPASGPPAKSPPAACTAPIASPRTACSKGSSTAPTPAPPRRAPRSKNPATTASIPLENPVVAPPAEPLDLADIRNSLKSLMWRNCGVRRTGALLAEALETVDRWRRYVLARQFADADRLGAAKHAHRRPRHDRKPPSSATESRGVHLRTDHPNLDDAHWNKHLWFQRSEPDLLERSGSA